MILNKTANTMISHRERYCTSFFSQASGLIFRRKQNLVMAFSHKRIVRLHMLFVFYPVDILILNENCKVIEIKRQLQPFRWWSSSRKGRYVLELALPYVWNKVKVGDVLSYGPS